MDTPQIVIIHLSDIHFGKTHRFQPQAAAGGDIPADPSYPTLLAKVLADLDGEDPGCPVLIALTGDFTQIGSFTEFKEAETFVRGLAAAPVLGRPRGLDNVFVIPGNHDVLYTSADRDERFQQWHSFEQRLRGRSDGFDGKVVHDRIEDLGAIVVTLNSSMYVERDKPDETRGRVDLGQLGRLQTELKAIDSKRLRGAIRVALVHHHPVLIPDLVEPGRGYDAVHDSAQMLTILRRFGFHLVLHGHKHNPHVFVEEATSAYRKAERHPLLIVAGGSVGSTEMPTEPRCDNCYNRIVVKWNPLADQTRIRVTTRGLCRFDADETNLLPGNWHWDTQREDDRQFVGDRRAPLPGDLSFTPFDPATDAAGERARFAEYCRLHFHHPVVEVMPSLEPGQVNEARIWMVRHQSPNGVDPGPELTAVKWSAGQRFPVVRVTAEEDPNLCAVLHYFGPMLIQADLEFADGSIERAHVYARQPGELGAGE